MPTVRISDKVMSLIEKYQAPRETYTQVIERAFAAFEALQEVSESLGPSHSLRERPKEEVR